MTVDKSALLAPRVGLNTEDIEIDGVGAITIRGLSRFELMLSSKRHPDDTLAQERFIVSTAMVEPVLTEADVETWQKNSAPSEINEVCEAINRLSGIGKGAAKSGVPGVRDEP